MWGSAQPSPGLGPGFVGGGDPGPFGQDALKEVGGPGYASASRHHPACPGRPDVPAFRAPPPLLGQAGRGRRGGFPVGFEGLPASVQHKGGSVNPAQLQSWREGSPGAQGPCGGLSADPRPVRSSGLSGGRAGPAFLSPQISHHLLSGTPCLNSLRVFLP